MSNASQQRALKNYRNRLNERGMARFEVLGLKRAAAVLWSAGLSSMLIGSM